MAKKNVWISVTRRRKICSKKKLNIYWCLFFGLLGAVGGKRLIFSCSSGSDSDSAESAETALLKNHPCICVRSCVYD